MVSNVVDADVHAVIHFGVRSLLMGGLGAGLWHIILGRDDLAIGIDCNSLGGNLVVSAAGKAVSNGLLCLFQSLVLAAFTADLLEVIEVALTHRGDVATTENTNFEIDRFCLAVLNGNLGTGALEILQSLEHNALSADVAGDGCRITVVGNQLLRRGQINTVDVGVCDLRSTTGQVDLLGSSLTGHADNLATRGTTDNAVINKQDVAVLELSLHGIELAADTLLAGLLLRHNERAEHVTVLHETMAVGLIQVLSDMAGRGSRGLRNGDDHVNVLDDLGSENFQDTGTKTVTHTLTATVHTDSIHDGVWASKVDILENIRGVVPLGGYLLEDRLTALLQNDSLTGLNVTVVAEAKLVQSNGLRCHHVISAFAIQGLARAKNQGADTVGVTETDESETLKKMSADSSDVPE